MDQTAIDRVIAAVKANPALAVAGVNYQAAQAALRDALAARDAAVAAVHAAEVVVDSAKTGVAEAQAALLAQLAAP